MPPAVGAAAIGATGAVAQGVGAGLSGGGGGGSPQIKLPPELEAQQLEIMKQSIEDFQKESARAGELADMMQQRANLLDQAAKGFIPYSDAENAITTQNRTIAEKYGAETLNVLNFGQELRGRAEELLKQPLAEYKDPIVEREINDFQRTMEEQMTRDFGPDWRNTTGGQRAMANFSQTASEMRSKASREMRTEELGTLGTLTNFGTTYGSNIFQGAAFGQNALLGGMSTTSQLANQTSAGAAEIGGARMEYSKYPFTLMQEFGKQNLSNDIRSYIKSSGAGGLFPEFTTYNEAKKKGQKEALQDYGASRQSYYSGYNYWK